MLDENVIASLVRRNVISDTFRRLASEKKDLIYRTAIRLFGKYGYDGLAVDEICRQAGISKGSFFQYFPSKSHLLEFAVLVFDDYLSRMIEEIRKQEKAVMARDRLMYLYHAIAVNTRLFEDEQAFYLFMTNAVRHAAIMVEGVDLERHFRDYINEIIARGERTGEIRGDFEIELTGYLVSVIIEGMVKRHYSKRTEAFKTAGEYLISFLFDGIKA
ncbi:MAG: TetR/AcrR family transcriptional regulator [Candidatus Zixiibacteriota bacterium]